MHAAVVSGFHISFLVGLVMVLTGRDRRAALAMIPLLMFYALMTGGTPSAFRAVIMQCALLAAPIARREEDAPSALGLALLGIPGGLPETVLPLGCLALAALTVAFPAGGDK